MGSLSPEMGLLLRLAGAKSWTRASTSYNGTAFTRTRRAILVTLRVSYRTERAGRRQALAVPHNSRPTN